MSELSDAEHGAMLRARGWYVIIGPIKPDGAEDAFAAGWLAARVYYKAEQQAERERLEEMVCKPRLEAR